MKLINLRVINCRQILYTKDQSEGAQFSSIYVDFDKVHRLCTCIEKTKTKMKINA